MDASEPWGFPWKPLDHRRFGPQVPDAGGGVELGAGGRRRSRRNVATPIAIAARMMRNFFMGFLLVLAHSLSVTTGHTRGSRSVCRAGSTGSGTVTEAQERRKVRGKAGGLGLGAGSGSGAAAWGRDGGFEERSAKGSNYDAHVPSSRIRKCRRTAGKPHPGAVSAAWASPASLASS